MSYGPEFCPEHGEHVPAIVHRSGGPSAKALNTCGYCGQEIAPLGNLQTNPLWIALTEEEADKLRAALKAAAEGV